MQDKSGSSTATEESQADISKRRAKGEFVRGVSAFRNTLSIDGIFPAKPNRYHLFVALNCPWCHRVTLARAVLGLSATVSMDVAYPNRTDEGDPEGPNLWEFAPQKISSYVGGALKECTADSATGKSFRLVKHIYEMEGSEEKSVPILYDKLTQKIVSNESAEIIRMLNVYAGELGSTLAKKERPDLHPKGQEHEYLRSDIDTLNNSIYVNINNGAYKAGFSSDQAIYQAAFEGYFKTLEELEALMESDGRPFLTGDNFSEADLRLFPTLYRHDPVYYLRMKLNGAKILDFPNLWRWVCRVYAIAGVAESSSLLHCRLGYFGRTGNRVIPNGPLKPYPYPEAYHHPDLARKADQIS